MFNPLPKDDATFAFPSQCILLKFNGAWPLKRTTDARNLIDYLYLFWSYTIITLIALTCYAQANFLFAAWGDVLTVTECGCTVFMGIHNLLRLIHLAIERSELRKIVDEFVKNIWVSKNTNTTVSKQCEQEMIVLRYISLLQFILIWMYILLPLLELATAADDAIDKPFPYNMKFPYNANQPTAYGLTYFLTSLAGFSVVTTLFSEDSLFGFFTTHTCGRLRLLHESIDSIMKTGQEQALQRYPKLMESEWSTMRALAVQREYQLILIKIIHNHNVIIGFYDDLREFFSPILLVNYIISSLLICMVGLQIVAVKLTIFDFMKLVVYIVSALSQLFILCWKGNDLIEISQHTADSFYSCNWQGLSDDKNVVKRFSLTENQIPLFDCPCSVDVMKNLKFAIRRSQKPLVLRASKFSILAMTSFTRVLSTSVSYFTLLQTLVEQSN